MFQVVKRDGELDEFKMGKMFGYDRSSGTSCYSGFSE